MILDTFLLEAMDKTPQKTKICNKAKKKMRLLKVVVLISQFYNVWLNYLHITILDLFLFENCFLLILEVLFSSRKNLMGVFQMLRVSKNKTD